MLDTIEVEVFTWTREERDEFIRDWIKALRSGEYAQANERLAFVGEEFDEFCCLGVVCDLTIQQDLGIGEWIDIEDTEGYDKPVLKFAMEPLFDIGIYEIWESTASLPKSLKLLLGISKANEDALIKMNDDGSSFDDIATFIEQNILPTVPDLWNGISIGSFDMRINESFISRR